MDLAGPADLVVVNASVVTMDPRRPRAEAVAVRAGRITAVGSLTRIRALAVPATEVIDAEGGVVVPAFHDAHLHLLSYARRDARLDCSAVTCMSELRDLLTRRAVSLPSGTWLRATGLDESQLVERRLPDRFDLDVAVPDRPVRLQHRTLHLDVLNTLALQRAGLLDLGAPEIERDPESGDPTGRLYHAAELLHARLPRPTEAELGFNVRRVCDRLLAWGVTTVQDASITNGPDEWDLFRRLIERGYLPLRVFMMPGASHWQALGPSSFDSDRLRLGPVKVMLDEATCDPAEARARVSAARAAGRAVAVHAVTEAEVAVAVDALRSAGPRRPAMPPDRIEHGAVIPDELLDELRAAGVTIVGQPALVHRRGDVYLTEYPAEQHGWLHRVGSLVRAGVPYAASSDAPLTEPVPGLSLLAATQRRTTGGAILGPAETLTATRALATLTVEPARAVGVDGELGRLRPGMRADLAVLDRELLNASTAATAARPVRLTIMDGKVVWRRPVAN